MNIKKKLAPTNYIEKDALNRSSHPDNLTDLINRLQANKARLQATTARLRRTISKAKVSASDDTAGADTLMPVTDDPRALLTGILELLDGGISADDLRTWVAEYLDALEPEPDAETAAAKAAGLVRGKMFGRDAWLRPSPFEQPRRPMTSAEKSAAGYVKSPLFGLMKPSPFGKR